MASSKICSGRLLFLVVLSRDLSGEYSVACFEGSDLPSLALRMASMYNFSIFLSLLLLLSGPVDLVFLPILVPNMNGKYTRRFR